MDVSKVHKLLIFIEENYNKEISIEELENISHSSYRNIQRIFKKIFNETIGEFKTRLKLEKGFSSLVYSDEDIVEIALKVGYENNQSFTKAFKKKFNFTPNQARQKRETIFIDFIKSGIKTESNAQLVYLDKKKVNSRLLITSDYDNETINNFWDELYSKNFKNTNYYGLIIDQPLISLKSKSRYEACFDYNNSIDSKEKIKFIFGGKYMKYIHLGSYDTILDTYRSIYADWLIKRNFEILSSPIVEMYEIGRNDTEKEEDFKTIIYVPVK